MTKENSKNKTKFRLINGGRDELEKELVRALFSIDNVEKNWSLSSCSERINRAIESMAK